MKRITVILAAHFLFAANLFAQAATNSVSPATATGETNAAANREFLSTTMVNASEREFKPRDIFRYSVKEDPSPSREGQEAVVTDAGEVHFPVSGSFSDYVTVNVRNKKLPEIRAEVKRMLDEKYYEDATVLLDLASINRNTFNSGEMKARARIYGALNGTIPLPEGEEVWLSDAVIGLGRNEMADLKKVKLHRKSTTTGTTQTIDVNVEKILKTNARNLDFKLQDGDRIQVPDRTFIW